MPRIQSIGSVGTVGDQDAPVIIPSFADSAETTSLPVSARGTFSGEYGGAATSPSSSRNPKGDLHDIEMRSTRSGKRSAMSESASGRYSDRGAKGQLYSSFLIFQKASTLEDFPVRRIVSGWLNSSFAEGLIAFVILVNFFLIILDTDARADGGAVPNWVDIADTICFIIFALELASRFFCEKRPYREMMKSGWVMMDTAIVVVGTMDYFVRIMAGLRIEMVRFLRLVRLLRILRVLRLFAVLKELRRLIQMMGGCFKTLFWSCLLLMIVMTIWAIVAVELVHPYMLELEAKGEWEECIRCHRALGTVFEANLTLFQTVVAGDSWGAIAVPVIEYQPLAALFFVGALMTLVFGVLNLIVAVIVDVFAESREKDFLNQADEIVREEKEQKKILGEIFDKIDEDRSGSLSYDELVQGAQKVAEFARCLRVMDIDARDLEQLFNIVDVDGSGEVDPEEFIEAMYRMKNADSKTATKFVKHIVTRMDEDNREMKEKVADLLDHVYQNQGLVYASQGQDTPPTNSIEDDFSVKLQLQEQRINQAIEQAVSKASQVALQAAMAAATTAASDVMGKVNKQSKQLARSMTAKMEHEEGLKSRSLCESSFDHSHSTSPRAAGRRMRTSRQESENFMACVTGFGGGRNVLHSGQVVKPVPQATFSSMWDDPEPSLIPIQSRPLEASASTCLPVHNNTASSNSVMDSTPPRQRPIRPSVRISVTESRGPAGAHNDNENRDHHQEQQSISGIV